MNKENLICSWDQSEIIDSKIKYIIEELDEDEYFLQNFIEEEEIKNIKEWIKREGNKDILEEYLWKQDFYTDMEFEFEDMLYCLNEFLGEYTSSNSYYATIDDFGWRNLSGSKYFAANSSLEFLREILPDTDCTYYIYDEGDYIRILNYHHDSPTGETYYVYSLEKYFQSNLSSSDMGKIIRAFRKDINDETRFKGFRKLSHKLDAVLEISEYSSYDDPISYVGYLLEN